MKVAALLFVSVLMKPLPAFAYVDPGSGSLLLQALAAVGVGLLFYLSRIRDFLLRLFRRSGNEDTTEPSASQNDKD